MRARTLIVSLVVAMMAVTTALPALAVKPVAASAEVTFPDVNPCTGEEHLVTIAWDIAFRENRNSVILTFDTTITTSDGWSGTGRETQVLNDNHLINSLSIFVSDGDGSVYSVIGPRKIDPATGEVTLGGTPRIDCIRN